MRSLPSKNIYCPEYAEERLVVPIGVKCRIVGKCSASTSLRFWHFQILAIFLHVRAKVGPYAQVTKHFYHQYKIIITCWFAKFEFESLSQFVLKATMLNVQKETNKKLKGKFSQCFEPQSHHSLSPISNWWLLNLQCFLTFTISIHCKSYSSEGKKRICEHT